jgi:hypothetical protein
MEVVETRFFQSAATGGQIQELPGHRTLAAADRCGKEIRDIVSRGG